MSRDIYQRTEALIGSQALETIKGAKVLVCGLGGVGGYCLEALARAGVGTLGLCDFDTVDPTNLNRQILALTSSIGRPKAELAAERVKDINANANVLSFAWRITEQTLPQLNIASWDYIADCIDDVEAKVLLVRAAKEAGVPILCAMGAGNKMDASSFRVCSLKRTEQDRLARSMRKRLRAEGLEEGVMTVYSPEPPVSQICDGIIPSISYMPATAGLRMAGEILQNLIR